ncbi:hypothetical protein DAMA08_032250 [Martiniozyma asiatica (nom. inval.)]|nr:hypothetical protein DAMA08_032250 [Martiniozyma asiatica]
MINSISIEETNKLRQNLGLKLIPILNDESTNVKIENLVSISVEETNRLRQKLGLTLIPIKKANKPTENENYNEFKAKKESVQKIEDLKSNLSRKRNEIKRKKMLDRGGILDRQDDLGLDEWLENVGKGNFDIPIKSKSKNIPAAEKEGKSGKLIFKQKKPKVAQKEKIEVLTLKDQSVLSDNDQLDDILETENVRMLQRMKTVEEDQITSAKADPRFLDQQDETFKKQKKFKRLKPLSDDELDFTQDIAKPKFKKPKKSQKRERIHVNQEFQKVVLQNDDENDDENDELQRLISITRMKKMTKLAEENSVQKENEFNAEMKLPAVNSINTKNPGAIFDENLEFLNTLTTDSINQLPDGSITSKNKSEPSINAQEDNKLTDRIAFLREPITDTSYSISSMLSHLESHDEKQTDKDGIRIRYTDDEGRELTTKQAYKYLSHKFHGTK